MLIPLILVCVITTDSLAHHGVASLGVAGLEGPGAPIETSSSATLPQGGFLAYIKLDYAKYDLFTPERDDEGYCSAFWMYGLGYGMKPYLSLYAFAPFYSKRVEDNSYNTSGFADLSLMGVLGFKYDRGLKIVPVNESLDDLEDWHFTVYAGLSLPTGDVNIRDADGNIDPGMSLGFGNPSYQVGLTATKPFLSRLTWVFETSFITFSEYEYADGNKTRFGDEVRLNSALTFRLLTVGQANLRVDGNIEVNYLKLGRDEADGVGEDATGGQMMYTIPGVRLFYKNTSLGLGLKFPAWIDLNEEDEQQGAEGKENYRAVVTFSALF